ncbi:pitrilysin family protein [Rhodoferax sp.]|uniref:M16 family metallopeptidase n=1 Tax=Rhodoferax sp. TaxID=50421 RepID=UPI002623377A|nr:pitrilysin family protein [Rhodoferax sp.]MDD5479214.1 pitrilysin family protein [Rhodoferax sp.]
MTLKKIAAHAFISSATALFLINSAWAAIPIEHWTQPQGAQVFLVQNHAIPMVDVQLDFDAGSRRDPASQAGLATVTSAMMSKGLQAGTASAEPAMDENALGEAWADLGAHFGGHASTDRMSFALRSLAYPELLAQAAALASRQLAQPAFPAAVWQREREAMQASIREANTRPATVAGRAFNQAVYGTHPYGFEVTPETLAAIDVRAMADLHQRSVLACRATVTVVGAVTRDQADALVSTLLSRLAPAPKPASTGAHSCPALPAVADIAALTQAIESRLAFDSAQAHVLMGQPGFKRNDPDFLALTVGNYILGGGGFVSRLTEEVREKRGLSYSVYSYFAPAMHAGAFTIGLQTRPDQAEQALQVAREVLARFVSEGPTEAELQAAKANLIGGFALRLDSNRKLLDNVANIAWNKLPLNYLDTWTQHVEQLTTEQIRAAFARKLQPQRMATVVLGAAAATPAPAISVSTAVTQ